MGSNVGIAPPAEKNVDTDAREGELDEAFSMLARLGGQEAAT